MNEAIRVDARGLSCPEPIIRAKQAMRQEGATRIEVVVDSGASRDNVKRIAEMAGWTARVTQLPGGEYQLDLNLSISPEKRGE